MLEKDDPIRNMTNEEILENTVSLKHSCLVVSEKVHPYYLLHKYKDAFNLRDEIGDCPMEVVIEVINKCPFL